MLTMMRECRVLRVERVRRESTRLSFRSTTMRDDNKAGDVINWNAEEWRMRGMLRCIT